VTSAAIANAAIVNLMGTGPWQRDPVLPTSIRFASTGVGLESSRRQ